MKVFWSWQSDRPSKLNRNFLKRVIVDAIQRAASELGLDERPEIDHDTQGEAGLVSIPETILRKIDEAAVFVADITPIAVSPDGKFVANPNVLIELGYAKKALGPERIILIWNSAWEGCRPEDLPFDLRHRRAPSTFSLGPDATKDDFAKQSAHLVSGLAGAIAASLEKVPATIVPAVERIAARPDDPSVWFPKGGTRNVNAGTSYGTDRVSFPEGRRSYIRIAPRCWGPEPLAGTRDNLTDLFPLGDTSGMTWGRTKGGVICYSGDRTEDRVQARTATQWFQKSGEIWGFDSKPAYEMDEKRLGIATDYLLQCWQRFMRRHAKTFAAYGVVGPYDIELGVTGVEKLYWPKEVFNFGFHPAVEDELVTRAQVKELDAESIGEVMSQAANAMRYAFGFEPFSDGQLKEILEDPRRQ
jgi:hypothetical protein